MQRASELPKEWKPCLIRSRLLIRFDPESYVYMRETRPSKPDGDMLYPPPERLLEEAYFAYLCTVDSGMTPHVTPMFFVFRTRWHMVSVGLQF